MMHPRRLVLPAVLMAVLSLPAPAYAWFAEGHRVVGAIADLILENHPVTRAEVKKLLDNGTLADASTLPDCAKGAKSCDRALTLAETESIKKYKSEKKNKRHYGFHYTDVPVVPNEPPPQYEAETVGTEDHDVVQIIRYAIKVLRSPKKNVAGPAKFDRAQALWVLTHLVGDIHQPLHVGSLFYDDKCEKAVDPNKLEIGEDFAGTFGGNDLLIKDGGINLHELWDGTTVWGAMKKANKTTIEEYAKLLMQSPPAGWEPKGDIDSWSEQWADEILPLSHKALTDASIIKISPGKPHTDGKEIKCAGLEVTLDPTYLPWASGEAEKQLAKAGLRLAAVLLRVFENK
jgi:hypothetical protein